MPQPSERAIGVAKKVLAKIASYDPYFPQPSPSMGLAWAEQISIANMTEQDMLDGVTKFYESAVEGAKPLPASIIMLANQIRIQRIQGESREAREEREDRRDAQLEGREYVRPIEAGSGGRITMAEWEQIHGTRFPKAALGKEIPDGPNPLKVGCPWCKQPPGSRCIVPGTDVQLRKSDSHDARLAVAEGRCAAYAGYHVNPHSDGCDLGGMQ